MARILITGGAGYVGSHCAKALAAAGHEGIVFDSLLFGHRECAVTGVAIDARDGPRRPGDPSILVAEAIRARELLGWSAECSDLATIITDAWRWHRDRFRPRAAVMTSRSLPSLEA